MKKGQVNQVFIYLVSIIIVVFIGFLVTKFISTFSGDVETRLDSKIYESLKTDYGEVYRTFGSEEVNDYRLSGDVRLACFVNRVDQRCLDDVNSYDDINYDPENFNLTVEGGDNVILFDKNGIGGSTNIGSFIVENNCLCISPVNRKLSLVFENKNNDVYIFENN